MGGGGGVVGYENGMVENDVVDVMVVVVVVGVIVSVVGKGDMTDNSARARALIVGDVTGVCEVVVSVVVVVIVLQLAFRKSRRSS